MSDSTVRDFWSANRKARKKIKAVDRNLEMVLERHLSGTALMQAVYDCRVFGVYEIPLLAEAEGYLSAEGTEALMGDLLENTIEPIYGA